MSKKANFERVMGAYRLNPTLGTAYIESKPTLTKDEIIELCQFMKKKPACDLIPVDFDEMQKSAKKPDVLPVFKVPKDVEQKKLKNAAKTGKSRKRDKCDIVAARINESEQHLAAAQHAAHATKATRGYRVRDRQATQDREDADFGNQSIANALVLGQHLLSGTDLNDEVRQAALFVYDNQTKLKLVQKRLEKKSVTAKNCLENMMQKANIPLP